MAAQSSEWMMLPFEVQQALQMAAGLNCAATFSVPS
jgi:hypothetical protein